MKKGIHPEYREVLFQDISVDEYFLISSTLKTDKTKEWEDGKMYGPDKGITVNLEVTEFNDNEITIVGSKFVFWKTMKWKKIN